MMEVVVKVEDADHSFLSLSCDVKQDSVEIVPKEEIAADDVDATCPGYSDTSQQVAMVKMMEGPKALLEKGCPQPGRPLI